MSLNSFCFLGLGFLSFLLLIYIWSKTGSRSLLIFMAMVGLGYMIEGVIYIFLDSYHYYPKLIKHDSYYDSNMGAIASNAFALPGAGTFIAVFRKNWIWILLMIAVFSVIEWLFLELHIYTHYWWKTGYTSFGLLFYFLLAKKLYKKMLQPVKGILHTMLLYLIVIPFPGTLHILSIIFFSNRYYELGWFENRSHDTTAFACLFFLSFSILYVTLGKLQLEPRWIKYAISVICMHTANLLLEKAGILHSLVWWDKWFFVFISISSLWFTEFISKCLSTGPLGKPKSL